MGDSGDARHYVSGSGVWHDGAVARFPLDDAPDRVRVFQNAISAATRLAVLRAVLDGPATFPELTARLEISGAGIRNALEELEDAGYVVADSAPTEGRRRRRNTTFTAQRATIMADLAQLLTYLAG